MDFIKFGLLFALIDGCGLKFITPADLLVNRNLKDGFVQLD